MMEPVKPCVGIPREIKDGEHRVAGLPCQVRELVEMGCRVIVQRDAGAASGHLDEQYQAAGAELVETLETVYDLSEVMWKVKEILPAEFDLVRSGQVIFTYLHAPPRPDMVRVLRDAGCIVMAYEEMADEGGRRPLLAPMSRMAGAGAIAVAAQFSQSIHGGCGKLMFRTEGAAPMTVLILGGGGAGQAAADRVQLFGQGVHFLARVEDGRSEGGVRRCGDLQRFAHAVGPS